MVEAAYFPWIGALHSLLDNLVDTTEDRATGQHSLIGCYDSMQEAAARMGELAERALAAARSLPNARAHTLVLAAMASFYLCTPEASTPEALPLTRAVLGALDGPADLTMLVFRARLGLRGLPARRSRTALARGRRARDARQAEARRRDRMASRSSRHARHCNNLMNGSTAPRRGHARCWQAEKGRTRMLELRDLVKHYPEVGGEPVRAVDGVSMTVEPGEMVALYGPSGSGKTTLLLMVATLLAPTSGAVLIGGRDVSSLSEREASHFRLSELGFIRQNFDLLPGVTAIDNAVLKLLKTMRWRDAHRQVAPLLDRLGLGGRLEHRAETLSMGERQRVMIARALSTEPRLLLADEPTGSLDSQRGREVLELLTELCREHQVAIVLVSHDPQAAAYADRVYALRDGKLGEYEPDGRLTRPVAS